MLLSHFEVETPRHSKGREIVASSIQRVFSILCPVESFVLRGGNQWVRYLFNPLEWIRDFRRKFPKLYRMVEYVSVNVYKVKNEKANNFRFVALRSN